MKTTKNARIISFINMKGGVGKTTLTKELGFFLAKHRDKEILFVDLDPQSNLTQSFFRKYKYKQEGLIDDISTSTSTDSKTHNQDINNMQDNSPEKSYTKTSVSIQKLFTPGKIAELKEEDCILHLDTNISIIPGTLKAVFLERNHSIENHLYTFIKRHNLKEKFDYIFIDCPPTYSNYTIAALISSEYYITPSRPDSYSILGIDMLTQVVEQIKDHHQIYFEHKPLIPLGVVFSELQYHKNKVGIQSMISTIKSSRDLKKINIEFFDAQLVYNSHIPKKPDYFIADSNSATIEELTILADEFERRIKSHE